MSTLLGYYENCNISIDNLQGGQETLQDQLKLVPSFTFSGIDENCPDLYATVWMEPPAGCTPDDGCPAEGYKTTIEPADIVNGEWSHEFLTSKVNGLWYAHVTVTPAGFECAMAITDGCTPVNVALPCDA